MARDSDLVSSLKKPVLQALQDWFGREYDVGTGVFDGQVRPLTFETNHKHYCKAVRRTPAGIRRCRHSDACLIRECHSHGDVVWRVCENGLLDLAAPIRDGKRIAGYLLAGQLRGAFGGLRTDGGAARRGPRRSRNW